MGGGAAIAVGPVALRGPGAVRTAIGIRGLRRVSIAADYGGFCLGRSAAQTGANCDRSGGGSDLGAAVAGPGNLADDGDQSGDRLGLLVWGKARSVGALVSTTGDRSAKRSLIWRNVYTSNDPIGQAHAPSSSGSGLNDE
jgi:hypothetical protein